MHSLRWAVLGAIAQTVGAQFVAEPSGFITKTGHAGIQVRYKEVPTGICELDPTVKSFSGYADVAENEHIFFWFFEARDIDPTEAPLTVWINGGPGSSSMIGLFQELGPCGVDYFGKVYNNPYSWSTVSNMIFIDQPTQVGFSYSIPVPGYTDPESGDIKVLPNVTCPAEYEDSCGTYSYPDESLTANSTVNAAPNMWKTLQGFMGVFPQYSRSGFNFASESYGGHYAPVFNEYIEKQNAANISGAVQIQLESVLIGNGWYDPIVGYEAYYNFTVFPGNTYDYAPYNESTQQQVYDSMWGPGGCLEQLEACKATGDNTICSDADYYCAVNIEIPFDDVTNRSEYDIRELTPDPFPYNFYPDYLNRPDVQAAIGAYVNFSDWNPTVGSAFSTTGDDGRDAGTLEALQALLGYGVTVALYAGDADYICNWIGNEKIADMVGARRWSKAGYVDVITPDGKVNAQTKQAGKFSFTRVFESGHEVPFYQPVVSLEMFRRVINGRDVATGTVVPGKCYITKGTPKSEYREGNGTIQWEVVPTTRTYDVNTHEPGPPWTESPLRLKRSMAARRRSFKPGNIRR